MVKKLATTGVLLAAIAASVGAYYFRRGGSGAAVGTAAVTEGDVVQSVTATGTLEAVRTVDIGSQVSGTIAALHADYNSIVRKGQLVAEIDPSLMRAQTEQARAALASATAGVDRLQVALDSARTTLKRAEGLDARQLITTSDLDTARVAVRLAEAQLRAGEAQLVQARASLNQCVVNEQHASIYAPIDGIVISRAVDVGQTVAASMQAPTLFTVAADLSKMVLKASVSETDIGPIREGQAVRFRVDAYPDETFAGTVAQVRLQATTSSNVVTYTTIIDVPNPTLRLRPGMTATTTIEIARRIGVLRVPNAALRFRPTAAMFAALGQAVTAGPAPGMLARPASDGQPGVRRVWLWANEQLVPATVATGITDGTYAEVIGPGPSVGAELVTSVSLETKATVVTSGSPLMQNGPPGGMPPPPPPGGGGPPR